MISNKWLCIKDYITTTGNIYFTKGNIYYAEEYNNLKYDNFDLIKVITDDGSKITMGYIKSKNEITDLTNDTYFVDVIELRKDKLKSIGI